MTKFKTCSNGHNFDESKHNVCPYCPVNSENADYEKTLVDFKKTQVMNDEKNNQFDKTMINEETVDFKATPTGGTTQNSFKRTTIVTNDSNQPPLQQSVKRKLVGWLVTFCSDEFGQDFKLYVGKNKIGSAPGCDVLINDSSISGEHTTILFRDNEFLIKDNFSTNGTKINGVTVDEGKLKEGDELKLGNTTFKFKTVF
jgi:hypothetical protein